MKSEKCELAIRPSQPWKCSLAKGQPGECISQDGYIGDGRRMTRAQAAAGMTIVACRTAQSPLLEGSEIGEWCRACNTGLQVTAAGRAAIAAGGTPYCNDCAFRKAQALAAEGAKIEIATSPTAQRQLETEFGQDGLDLAAMARRYPD